MKVLRKRTIAYMIDSFIIGFLFDFIRIIIIGFIYDFGDASLFIVFTPLFLQDLLFKNASLGKKIMGLVVLDENWNPPSKIMLIKRIALMYTVGYIVLGKVFMITGDIIDFFDWERDVLKMIVIDKKVLAKLRSEVGTENPEYNKKMSELYCEYLRNTYTK